MNTFIAIKNDETRATFLDAENMALLAACGRVRELDGSLTRENAAGMIGDSDVYMTCWGSPRLDSQVLAGAPSLKLLVHLGGTVAPFVSPEMAERGIRVISGNAYFAESTAEGALAYILAAQRDIPFYSSELKQGRWKAENAFNRGLIGKTVGIVSCGAVAKNLIRLLQPFRVKLLVYDIVPLDPEYMRQNGITQVSLETLFSESDVISVHTPLNSGTHHLITGVLFALIKPGALFVNTSRGAVIDQAALEKHVRQGRFRAALDVYDPEPPLPGSGLFGADNVLMMPHMGGPTLDLRSEIARSLIEESRDFIDSGAELKNEIPLSHAFNMSER